MTISEVRTAIRPRSRQAELQPADISMAALDLEAAGPFSSDLIDLRDNFVVTIYSEVTDTAATTGVFSIFLDLYDRSADNVIDAIELLNTQTSASTNTAKLTFGQGLDASLDDAVGTSGAVIGTRVPGAKIAFLARFRVVNDTPADGASVLSLRVMLGD